MSIYVVSTLEFGVLRRRIIIVSTHDLARLNNLLDAFHYDFHYSKDFEHFYSFGAFVIVQTNFSALSSLN